VVHGMLVRPLAFSGSDRLVWIANTGSGGMSSVTSRVSTFLEWRKANRSFEELTAYFAFFDYGSYTMLGVGEPSALAVWALLRTFSAFLACGRSWAATSRRKRLRTMLPLQLFSLRDSGIHDLGRTPRSLAARSRSITARQRLWVFCRRISISQAYSSPARRWICWCRFP
jgi:hypothetical protein